MVHGWPSLWSSWSNQITEFEKDHRVIALDQRGFGSSTHPGNVHTSASMGDLVDDLVCVLQDAGVETAMCMGHDWGSQVCYEAARQRPDIFTSVVGLAIPYIPYPGPFVPNTHLLALSPKLAYQIFFDEHTARATQELDYDKRRTLRGTLRDIGSPPPWEFLTSRETFMGGWEGVDEIPPIPFFSEEEEAYFIEQYETQGFGNTLYFYTHGPKHESWKHAQAQGNFTIPCRALSILPLQDPVGDWVHAAKVLQSAKFVPRLTTEVSILGSLQFSILRKFSSSFQCLVVLLKSPSFPRFVVLPKLLSFSALVPMLSTRSPYGSPYASRLFLLYFPPILSMLYEVTKLTTHPP
ncbi:Alpha/Beta hydrolase protein [Pterulicium gracile]|uniref:Alpha/Beta hydrolase protein n=1 Tax=Pterulicium gracile TaxID=1884261 RepID=A0A5C3QIL6_9AGAR|nr:Alpha/Beta hydrolase protein [Pterula gracilis]